MDIALIGAGIGGTACALALSRAGHRVRVFEQADALAEIGAGLTMAPNATRLFGALGIGHLLDQLIIPPESRIIHGLTGEVLTSAKTGDLLISRFGAPYGFLHRADLLDALADALRGEDLATLHLNHQLVDLDESSSGVMMTFSDGSKHRADLVIGCDGIKSTVRQWLFGKDQARFTGNIAWRGLVPIDRLPAHMSRPHSGVWAAPRRHFVQYTIRDCQYMNYVAIAEKSGWEVEGWMEPSTIDEVLDEFSDWQDDVLAMIKGTPPDACFKWALFDRDPIPTWSRGRVTLLGDAAHPMLPFLGQGAAMALEDAIVLSRALSDASDVEQALQAYEGARRERTTWTQLESRAVGALFHGETISSETFANDRSMQTGKLFSYNALTADIDLP